MFELAGKKRNAAAPDLSEYIINTVRFCISKYFEGGVMCEKNHYAYMVGAVELMKNKMFENVKKPSLKKYLLCIEVYKWRCKDWNYKERRMKAISSESGMDIT